MNTSLRLPISTQLPPCIEHAIRQGPAPEDGFNWISVLASWWKAKGADEKTFPLFLKIWFNDSDTTEDLDDKDFDNFAAVGWGGSEEMTCVYLLKVASFKQGCTKTGCLYYVPPDEHEKMEIPPLSAEDYIGRMQQQPVNVGGLSEELVRRLNIKRLPGGVLAVYNNGVYITEDSEYLIDAVVRNYLKNEMNTKLRSNLFMHIKALADPVVWDDFERFTHLLCCPNGVVDLTNGSLLEHNPIYMMLHKTRAPYDPKADRKLWEKTLKEIATGINIGGPSKDIYEDQLEYHKKIWGLSITGETRDEILFIHQGAGGSGKTVITGTVQNAMGSYVQQVSPDIFVSKSDHYTPSYELANGVGKRIFLTNESKEGGKINTQLIKVIATEGAEFNARQIREKPFTYTLRAKAHLVLNPPPIIDEHDKSVKRRLHMIRYLEDFTEHADLTLKKVLKTESRGVLAWLIEGAVSYYNDGLKPTTAVNQAVMELFDDSDPLYGFIDCTLEPAKGERVSSRELFKAFKQHCNGMMVSTEKIDPRPFGRMLNAQLKLKGWKYQKFASNGETVYQDVRYKSVYEHE